MNFRTLKNVREVYLNNSAFGSRIIRIEILGKNKSSSLGRLKTGKMQIQRGPT